MKQDGCITFAVLVILMIILVCVNECHNEELSADGFKVIEKHNSYYLVEKDGHQYIATETGMYSLNWNYEHYPNCPCKKKQYGKR